MELIMNFEQTSMCIMAVPEGAERAREKETNRLFEEIMNKNLPNLWKDMNTQIKD